MHCINQLFKAHSLSWFLFFLEVFPFKISFQKVAAKLNEIGNCKTIEAHLIPSPNYFKGPVCRESGVRLLGTLVSPHKSRHQGG